MVKFVREWFRSWFPAPAAPAPITVVSPFKSFEYKVLHSHRGKVVAAGSVTARCEADAVKSIYALTGERIQFANGGRYRVHHNADGMLVTRIDRADRRTAGDRKRHRDRHAERGDWGTVGE